ncbi:MAG TPA: hypothetical protein VMQ81_08945 [Acidimicrobiia bacterium]|nr:hypothetical protein [Acidimicrobiia bacterium]
MTRTIEDRQERRELVENRRDRLQFIRDAGWRKVSGFSVAAGVLTAYGAFALFLAMTASVLHALGVDSNELNDNEWRNYGAGAGAAVVAVLFGAYLFGGYVAGRMARRAGVMHGILVFVAGIVVLAAVAVIAHAQDGTEALVDRLDALGAPTSGDAWAEVGSAVGIGAVIAALVGGVLGGAAGERWHQRLAARVLSPSVGPEADLEKQQRKLEKAEQRLERKREKAEKRGVLTVSRAAGDGQGDGDGDGSGATTWREQDEEAGRRAETVDLDLPDAERAEAERDDPERTAAAAAAPTPPKETAADDEKEREEKEGGEQEGDDESLGRIRDGLRTGPTGGTVGRR